MKAKTIIKKEALGYYRFPEQDVLDHEPSKKLRLRNLQKAVRLGNGFKQKVKINFKVVGYPYMVCVETTVWAVGDQFVFLKGGRTIPIKAIKSVEI